jgi:hypothetical protein
MKDSAHLPATLCLHSHALRSFPIKALAFPAPVLMLAEGIMGGKTLIISFCGKSYAECQGESIVLNIPIADG